MDPTTCPKCAKKLDDAPNYCPGCGADLRGITPTADTYSGPWAGKVIDGRYKLIEKLGEGGMGSVFKVEHVRMGKVLALKVLRPEFSLDKQAKARFHQEARVVSKLSHPNTIQVFDFGDLEDGSLYLAMEYLAGRDLSWMLRAHGAMAEEKAISVAVQVLASLAEAHDQGIIHRDIKPANVMLVKRKDRDEQVKVLDFGIAKLNEGEGRKHITGITDFVGTPAYMSPEQARGEDLDARSDLYSVGAMLFELVSGKSVFTGPTPMSIVTKHMSEPPPRLAEVNPGKLVSPAFEAVIRKALEKKREDRYADADQMRAALEKVRRDLGALSPDLTPMPEDISLQMASRADFDRFERSLRFRRAITPMLALALLGALGFGAFRMYQKAQSGVTVTAEREPNDLPHQATRIDPGIEVRGTIGAGSGERSDRDLYVLRVPASPLSIQLSGVDDLNLSFQVSEELATDAGFKLTPRVFVDDLGLGQGERVDGLSPMTHELYLRIEEAYHYDEPRRGPREKSGVEYRLSVTPISREGQTEVEPNDDLSSATGYGVGKPLVGYTGAAVPYPPPRELGVATFSSVDFLLANPSEPARSVWAIVVAPPEGKLLALDAATFETWDLKAAALVQDPKAKRPAAPKPRVTAPGEPELLSLGESSRGYGLRLQPAKEGGPPAGSEYQVAFITDSATGLAGAIALAAILGEAGRAADRTAVLELAATAFPDSPQIADIKSLLEGPTPPKATP